jgi:integrase
LGKIDEISLQKFLIHLKIEKKLAASSVNQARNAAFVALKYAKRHKLIKNFDFDAVLRASGRAEERGILEREEVEALFSLPWRDPRSRLICLIASQTGMRSGEIRALRLCDIQKELFALNSLLFPGANGNAPFVERQILKDFYSMLRQIGISDEERNIVFHSWRHYCAKNLAQVTNRAIGMAILGHKTSEMFDHYAAHVDKETFAKMGEAIQQGLAPYKEERKELRFPKEA